MVRQAHHEEKPHGASSRAVPLAPARMVSLSDHEIAWARRAAGFFPYFRRPMKRRGSTGFPSTITS